jgi:peptidoglycan/LPS O-acetylase OafA/YrhL
MIVGSVSPPARAAEAEATRLAAVQGNRLPAPRARRDLALEGLRGAAALVVFYHHVMVAAVGGWSPGPAWTWLVSGPAAVLVFFVLSGYVIGLAYAEDAPERRVSEYLRRRALRLIPINCAGVLLGCAVAESLDPGTVAGNLFFLQNFADYAGHWMLVLPTNLNLWSLNYEVLFYLAFAVLWRARLPVGWTAAVMAAVGLAAWFGHALPQFVACYAFGFIFWLSGLALAWRAQPAEATRSSWPMCVLLAALTWKLQGVAEVMLAYGAPPPRFAGPVVKLYTLDFLPVCVWLVASVARRTFPGLGLLRIAAAAIPAIGLLMRWRNADADRETALLATVYVGALLLAGWRPSLRWLAALAPVGAISFALYATARPIQIAVFRAGQSLPPNAASFAICAVLTTAAAFTVAWYLERRLQPAIVKAWGTKPRSGK